LAIIELLDSGADIPNGSQGPDNWYLEPFTKRKSCSVPGQCGGDCDCGCPYNTMTEIDQLPLISDIAEIFPNEWLAFIISPEEDDEYEPLHGKLVAHSLDPDEVYDAINTVLWNQHIFVYFNGNFESMQASYGQSWDQAPHAQNNQNTLGSAPVDMLRTPLPNDPVALAYSALDHLYGTPRVGEAIRHLRIAKVQAVASYDTDDPLILALDAALNKLETTSPLIKEIVWNLEEALTDTGSI
jgi:hypothetical protein